MWIYAYACALLSGLTRWSADELLTALPRYMTNLPLQLGCVRHSGNMKMAAVSGGCSVAKHMFEELVSERYAGTKGPRSPWSKERVAQVIKYIHGSNLARDLGKRRSNAEIYFGRSYEVLSVDGVERVVLKRTQVDGSVRIVLPREEYYDTLQRYHEKLGHVGFEKLCKAVKQRFALPRHIVDTFVSLCDICTESGCPPSMVEHSKKRKKGSKIQKVQPSVESNDTSAAKSNEIKDVTNSGTLLVTTDGNISMISEQNFDQVPQAPPAIQKQSAATQQLPPPPQPQKLVPPQVSAPKPIAPKPTSAQVSSLQPLPPPPEVCLRWNSYHSNMQATFPSLLNNEQFVDVTLACEGRSIKCHKMMLSACSAYFEELLSQNPCQHPIVLMKDLKYWEVQALVDFMYRGEVNVAQDKLPSLLAAAEALQIKGLAGPAFSSHDDESLPTTLPQPPFGGNEDYLDESSPPSPSGFRRAKKRRVPSTAQTTRSPPARSPVVQSSQMPVTPPRQSTGKRAVKSTPSMPSTSGIKQESSSSSEPLVRRARRSESGELEIKIEPIDIEISNDSMDQIDESYLEKTYETEVGDEELSAQGDDPGGTHQPETSASGDPQIIVHGQGSEQMDFGNDANDQNFTYDDSASQDGPSPELPGTSYHSQPMSSRMNNTSSNNLLGHM